LGASAASETRTATIVFGIIATVLTLLGIVVAIRQYLLQKRTRADVGTDEDDIEMSPQHSANGQGVLAALSP
jgi:hypothetical protein